MVLLMDRYTLGRFDWSLLVRERVPVLRVAVPVRVARIRLCHTFVNATTR